MGKVLAEGLGVGEGECDREWVGVADALAEEVGLSLGVVGVAVTLGETVAVAVTLGETVAVAETVPVGDPPGDRDGGVADGEDPVQAETDTEASTVTAAQLIAVKLALSLVPALVVRISTGPPSCLRQMAGPFPVLAPENPLRNGNCAARTGCCPSRPGAGPGKRRRS